MESLFKYMSPQIGVLFLRNLKLRFSPPLYFNDPFEMNPCVIKSHDNPDEDIVFNNNNMSSFGPSMALRHHFNDRIGVLSLSEVPDNCLMWGHYASNYSGMVIELDPTHDFFQMNDDNGFMDRVHYTNERPVITMDEMKALGYKLVTMVGGSWRRLIADKNPIFCTKNESWSYEKEWRYIRVLNSSEGEDRAWESKSMFNSLYGMRGAHETNSRTIRDEELVSIPPEAIKSVIVGPCSRRQSSSDAVDGLEEVVWEYVLSNPSLSHVSVKRALLDERSFSIKIIDTSNLEELEKNLWGQEFIFYITGFTGKKLVEERLKLGVKGINPYDLENYP